MKTIKDYLDSLFLNVPITPETKKAKEDLLAIMEDQYHGLLEEGKSEHEAIGAVISEFGSIDELLQELELSRSAFDEEIWENEIELDEALSFWDKVRNFSLFLSAGIAICILAVGIMIFLTNHLNDVIGLLAMFVLIALGVGLIITSSLSYSATKKKLNDRPYSQEVKFEGSRQTENYEKSFRVGLVLGITLCILSVTPFFATNAFGFPTSLALLIFFTAIALGVFFIVYVSIIYTWFTKVAEGTFFISDEDEPGPRASQHMYGDSAESIRLFERLYWPSIFVIYMVWSFLTRSWGYSWLLFVLGGIFEDYFLEKLKRK
ncbi:MULTISPECIES: permease prefix domain 1-containing protein [unclassified Enterococcus]|uniref:permease prefix domain 1-containing protein n=1 Tax=unclassified Enterococcus TaxID=2608891 RepID=UPI001A9A7972|nr:permease prefix domain 1-containing protein [Enterococcus sp. DIV1271a]MBO1298730.1 beta-carotene 15,15'-monooxygenase [Enterococcus sp. DIV1271a]